MTSSLFTSEAVGGAWHHTDANMLAADLDLKARATALLPEMREQTQRDWPRVKLDLLDDVARSAAILEVAAMRQRAYRAQRVMATGEGAILSPGEADEMRGLEERATI